MADTFIVLGGDSYLAKHFDLLFPNQCTLISKKDCDITSLSRLEEVLTKTKAQYVINTAAITDIDRCELDPILCFSVNTTGVYLLNKVCLQSNKKLIHISSDYATDPVNTYGWSKKLSEDVMDRKFLTIKTSFYSMKNYVIKKLFKKSKVQAYDNVFFNPLSVSRLCEEVVKNKEKQGILNLFSNKKTSKYSFACKAAKTFQLNPNDYVEKITFTNRQSRAQRPFDSFVNSDIDVDLIKDLEDYRKFLSQTYN